MAVACLGLLATRAKAAEGCTLRELADLPVDMKGLAPTTRLKVNGQDAVFVTDSGAFFSLILPDAAARLGLSLREGPFGMYVTGVGGREARLQIGTAKSFTLDKAELHDIQFLVTGKGLGSHVDGLLGQNVLSVFDTEYDLANGKIRLFQPQSCGKTIPTYWDPKGKFSAVDIAPITMEHRHVTGTIHINGQAVRAVFDSGAARSTLSLAAARRLGFRQDAPGVVAAGLTGGFGPRQAESWITTFDSLELGDGEQIYKARLRVADIQISEGEMLVGADFFLSHRIYLSKAQRRLYFTYNGGPIFDLDRSPMAALKMAMAEPGSASGPPGGEEPTTAADFARRAAASAARHDYVHALADYSRAIELEPKEPQHYIDRAEAHLSAHEATSALADVNQALALKPNAPDALVMRGALYLATGDLAHSDADFALAEQQPDATPDLPLRIAQTYVSLGRFPRAIRQLDGWITSHPQNADLGRAYGLRCEARALGNGELQMALADCEAAFKAGPRTATLYEARGLTHLRLKQYDLAIADYDQALKLQPKLAAALYGRGVAKAAKGDAVQGEADKQAAVVIRPSIAAQAKRFGIGEPAAPRPAATQ